MRRHKFILIPAFIIYSGIAGTANAQSNNTPADLVKAPQSAEAINKLAPQDTYSIPWAQIKEEDILWKKRVLRDIDINEAGNEAFQHIKDAPDFANMLIGGIKAGEIKAYNAVDGGRFSSVLTSSEFSGIMSGGNNPENHFSPAKVSKYRIKEDWLFIEKDHKMVVRIVGIAPVMKVTTPDGTSSEGELFWLYYPDIQNFLAQHLANTSDKIMKLNWDEFFETRNFKSTIVQVSEGYRQGARNKSSMPSGK